MADYNIDMEDSSSLPKQKVISSGLSIVNQQGFWLPSVYLPGIRDTIEHFKPLPTDIVMVSFPKTGTTWLKAILYSIVHGSSKHRLATTHIHQLVPFLEQDVYGRPGESPTPNIFCNIDNDLPRIFNTHIPYQLLAKALDPLQCRVVYVTRNPKDTLVSMWHFMNKRKMKTDEPWPIDMAVEEFCSQVLAYGPYYDHAMGYKKLSLEKPQNALFLTYEELKNDPKSVVRTLGSFLGFPFEGEGGEEEIEEIAKSCSFEVLSNHQVNKSEGTVGSYPMPKSAFYRKGMVGDYKNVLTHDMIEKIDALTREKFHSSGFIYGV